MRFSQILQLRFHRLVQAQAGLAFQDPGTV